MLWNPGIWDFRQEGKALDVDFWGKGRESLEFLGWSHVLGFGVGIEEENPGYMEKTGMGILGKCKILNFHPILGGFIEKWDFFSAS